jgi:YrbI family 3-deoxy-D-manno-octulosonate 8-phosphate phosphatase
VGQSYCAFIPVRAGSKSIPLKNIREIAGKPLVLWVLEAADGCASIGRIVVSTDSPEIARVVSEHGSSKVEIHHRSEESATDTASTESVMLEYARQNEAFDSMVLIQATSPLLSSSDLTRGIEMFESGRYDSLLSVVRQKRFIWDERDGLGTPANYDFASRPRRQDFEGFLVENGAFYITPRTALLETGSRLSGRIGLLEMDEASYFEIDEPSDWLIVEGLLEARSATSGLAAVGPGLPDLSGIKALFTDCDGVLTDGGMYYSEAGDELKKFITRDGVGFALLRERGIVGGVITSESVELVRRRAEKLRLEECHLGVKDKLALVEALCEKYSIEMRDVAYIGDDVMDVAVIEAVGFGCSVSDGIESVKRSARYVTAAKGGEGAVREVADLILAALKD